MWKSAGVYVLCYGLDLSHGRLFTSYGHFDQATTILKSHENTEYVQRKCTHDIYLVCGHVQVLPIQVWFAD